MSSLTNSNSSEINHCDIWPLTRQPRILFPVSSNKVASCFDQLHMNVWDPIEFQLITERDLFSQLLMIILDKLGLFLMHLKFDVITLLNYFIVMLKTRFDKVIKHFRSDNRAKFFNKSCSE